MNFFTIVLCLFVIQPLLALEPETGQIDLSRWNGEIRHLDEAWSFYWNTLLPEDKLENQGILLSGPWTSLKGDQALPVNGFGTYTKVLLHRENTDYDFLSLRIEGIGTAYRLFIDGVDYGGLGIVGRSAIESLGHIRPAVVTFPVRGQTTEILLQVSNYQDQVSGFWGGVDIGRPEMIMKAFLLDLARDISLGGALTVIGLFFFVFYIWMPNREQREIGIFGVFSLVMAFRIFLINHRILPSTDFFPFWEFWGRLEYWTIYTALPLFGLFILTLYPQYSNKIILRTLRFSVVVFPLLVLILPIWITCRTLMPFQIIIIVGCLYYFYILYRAVKDRIRGAWYIVVGFLFLFFSIIYDIIMSYNYATSLHLAPLGTFLFFLILSISLADRFFDSQEKQDALRRELKSTNQSLERFVPSEILHFLQKQDLTQVKLGDSVQKKMTVLFSDIKGFNKLSETMEPEDCFAFLNSYYSFMGPIIRKHGGFIDKYIGDTVMALFSGSVENALEAAISMQDYLQTYNKGRERAGYPSIKIGIGLHVGWVTLGTVGEKERMEGTVISDVVNLAGRMESLSRTFASRIIISDEIFRNLTNANDYDFMFLGRVQVKGKSESLGMYEILNGCEEKEYSLKKKIAGFFEKGLLFYHLKQIGEAEKEFEKVLEIDPNHKATQFYLGNCHLAREMMKENKDWQATLVMEMK